MLLDLFSVANCETFFSYLLMIANLSLFDPYESLTKFLPVNDNEAMNLHFEEIGYEYSDSILNMGSIVLIVLMAPVVFLVILLLKYICCWQSVRNYFSEQL